MSILSLVFLSQVVAITLIVLFLKYRLNRILIDTAIHQLENIKVDPDWPVTATVVVTHKPVADTDRERIQKAVTKRLPGNGKPEFRTDKKLLGGMVIKAGAQIIDYSLIDRLRKAR